MKFSILTFGCRVNQADSLAIEALLRRAGGVQSASATADVVVVNTCSVTCSADQGARQAIRRVARENPSARIVATGCYATRRPEELAALPGVARVVPNDSKHVADAWLGGLCGPTTAERFGAGEGACGSSLEPGVQGRTAFTLRVQTGCEEACSYCIIPSTRGAGRSLPIEDVLREVGRIVDSGFKEVALTGVHLGSYGRDLSPAVSLLDLLDALCRIPGDVTFRISSLEPMDCTARIVELVASSAGRFAPHFHLPLQHASDRMLQLMRRPYTLDYYRRLVDSIAARLPHASVGSDVIVGFPGETDDDFARTAEYVAAAPLSHLHVFPYSDRPGTAASGFEGKVPGPVVRERGLRLRTIGEELSRRFRASQIGTVRTALTIEDGTAVVTDNFLKVRIPAGEKRNTRLRVRLLEGSAAAVVG